MDEQTTMGRAWPIWLAVAGLGLMGLETILVAPASAALAQAITGGTWLGLESVITQSLLVTGIVALLAAGLLRGSRLAWGLALLLGTIPFVAAMYLLASNDPLALHRTTVRVFAASLFVLAGLGLAWPMAPAGTTDEEP